MATEVKSPIYMRVQVIERKLESEDDDIIQDYSVNYSDIDTKLWLTRLFVWAMYNDKIIELAPIKDVRNIMIFNPSVEKVA